MSILKKNPSGSGPPSHAEAPDGSPAASKILSDDELELIDRAAVGRPRMAWGSGAAVVRLSDEPDAKDFAVRRGGSRSDDGYVAFNTIMALSEPLALRGPATVHGIDELVAHSFALAPNFAVPLQAIRQGAQAMLRNGAQWFQFKPILIESPPGVGKTTWALQFGAASKVPVLHLDAAAMTTAGTLVSADSVWSSSRLSEVVRTLAEKQVANPIVILDEVDKMQNLSMHARPDATETLLPLLEKSGAAANYDHFLQTRVNLSFISWILLANDLNRIAKPIRDRCIVVRMAPPNAEQIADIAAREITRRGLPEDLVAPLVRAVRQGRLTSLRKLHKALDAASAASVRSTLN